MAFKKYVVKKLIDLNIIPCTLKWKKAISGIGRMYADIMSMMQDNYGNEGIEKLSQVMYKIGYGQAQEILKFLGLQRNVEGCAYVLLAMQRIFGIKSKIVEKEKNRIVIHVAHCYWGKRKKGWTPKTCASIACYETGLVKGILPSASHTYTKRRSLGENVCEIIIAL